mmetsp:Transcript_19684/g.51650  ORF Transcript_19684/g.51650 Transcript_19684/m.51650 type:complete len:247 (-) Transcript_19684:903-1643(-)
MRSIKSSLVESSHRSISTFRGFDELLVTRHISYKALLSGSYTPNLYVCPRLLTVMMTVLLPRRCATQYIFAQPRTKILDTSLSSLPCRLGPDGSVDLLPSGARFSLRRFSGKVPPTSPRDFEAKPSGAPGTSDAGASAPVSPARAFASFTWWALNFFLRMHSRICPVASSSRCSDSEMKVSSSSWREGSIIVVSHRKDSSVRSSTLSVYALRAFRSGGGANCSAVSAMGRPEAARGWSCAGDATTT